MIQNIARIGNFTSSEIANLMKTDRSGNSFGAAALTYIAETNMERRLGRSISDESNARPLTWGKLLEARAFDHLGLAYSLNSTETIVHPQYSYWSGSPDGFKHDEGKTVIDIKSPSTLKSFCQLVQPLYDGLTGMAAMQAVRDTHKDGDKFYWQLVSNAAITNSRYAELVVYMPYESELEDIKELAQDGESKHWWIANAQDGELPFIKDNGYYKNINIIRFEVPAADKQALTKNVTKAGALLIGQEAKPVPAKKPSTLIATRISDSLTLVQNADNTEAV